MLLERAELHLHPVIVTACGVASRLVTADAVEVLDRRRPVHFARRPQICVQEGVVVPEAAGSRAQTVLHSFPGGGQVLPAADGYRVAQVSQLVADVDL